MSYCYCFICHTGICYNSIQLFIIFARKWLFFLFWSVLPKLEFLSWVFLVSCEGYLYFRLYYDEFNALFCI